MADTLLLIEDEALLGAELARHFEREGWEVVHHTDLAGARRALLDEGLAPLVVLSDMNLPDGNALDLLEQVREGHVGGEWLFLTGYGTVADSVRALRLGAYDFLEKPCDQKRLDLIVAGAARSALAQRRLDDHADQQNRVYTIDAFVGESKAAAEVRDVLARLVEVPISALVIGGETGTGKGLVARILHYSGNRAKAPLVEVNCAALPRELLESELFGHEVGAFTGAQKKRRGLVQQAQGGTLFLDEISELELDLQAKLLKVIEDRRVRPLGSEKEIEVDVQVVAASNRNLSERIKEGKFRADLYHRLSVFELTLPGLAERSEDLEQLVPLIVAEFNAKAGQSVREIPDEIWSALRAYDWPGNVRELRNVIERCVLFAEGSTFPARWLQLPGQIENGHQPSIEGDVLSLPLDGSMSLEDMDRYIVRTALDRTGFNLTAAARNLGTTRQTLRYRAQKYGLTAPEGDEGSEDGTSDEAESKPSSGRGNKESD
ncbi:MAG: sigma-54-dependent Fis family transcriptional regulator [Deltaproteobacteria bacterium]|nr:sigma-54-dependent Fis family transcriptional regulator [Deltaproteobacteria bacterium]